MAGLLDFPNGAAFGTGSPAETAQQPSGLGGLLGGLYNSLGLLAKRAIGNSQTALDTGNYNPAPVMEAAMLPMGTGAIAGVPVRAGEAVLGAGPIRKIGGGFVDPTETGWIFKDVAHPKMEPGDWRMVNFLKNEPMDVELPIRSLNATQKTVNPDFANPVSANLDSPFVIKKDGQYYVQDGHHRITAASERGSETVKVRLADLDGTTQTNFPLLDLLQRYSSGQKQ